MSNLYTFGCSFTEDFTPFTKKEDIELNNRTKYVYEFCNGAIPKSWVDIVAEKMNLKLNNYGAQNAVFNKKENLSQGNCNFTIFNNFCELSQKFQENDIVIVEWTFMERFRWANPNQMVSILPNWYPQHVNKNTMDDIVINRSSNFWINELFSQMKLMDELSKIKNFKLYYWTIDKRIYEYKFDEINNNNKFLLSNILNKGEGIMDIVFKNGGNTIFFETDGQINDYHYGKVGHKILGDLFYNHIVNNI
jgi:hypothetical protein